MGISWGFKIDENGDFRDLVGSNEKDVFLALDEPLPSDKMGGHRSHRW